MNQKLFSNKDTWTGEFYELAMELPANDLNQIKEILQTILTFPSFDGYYLDMKVEPDKQTKIGPMNIEIDMEGTPHFLGIVTMPDGKKISSGVCIVWEGLERRWVIFYLPLGSLERVYDVGRYLFGDFETSPIWQESVDTWLASLGFHIFSSVSFRFATIGFESSGIPNKDEIDHDGIPEDRYIGYMLPENGILKYYPRNKTFDEYPQNP